MSPAASRVENAEVARIFREVAELLDIQGANALLREDRGQIEAAHRPAQREAVDLALFPGPGTIALPAVAPDLASQTGANSWSIGVRLHGPVTVTCHYQDCTTPAVRQSWGRIKSNYR